MNATKTLFATAFLTLGVAAAAEHRWNQTDLGPTFSTSLKPSGKGVKWEHSPKVIAVRVGDSGNAGIGFDTDMLRMVAGWADGFIRVNPGRNALLDHHSARGVGQFSTKRAPGWTFGGQWQDHPKNRGPVPQEQGRYRGLYMHGDRVVLSYTIGKAGVLESPWLLEKTGLPVFTRSFEAAAALAGESVAIAQGQSGKSQAQKLGGVEVLVRESAGGVVAVAVKGDAAVVDGASRGLAVKVTPGTGKLRFKVYIWQGPREDLPKFAQTVKADGGPELLAPWTQGGPRRWTQDLVTQGQLGEDKGPYVIDTLTPPFDNPWKSILHFGGHDFFRNGDAAICTMEGDVWIVKGIDEKLGELTWQRIATGLYHPLGLRIVDDSIYVAGRDQITRLHDLNLDGETDFYESFNNQGQVSLGSHEYVTALETDPEGHFYYIKCSNGTEHGGSILKVDRSGTGIERVATGFRNPNGFFVGANGIITAADQQGGWVPSSRVDIIQPGGFYGFMPMHHRETAPETYDGPVTWIPHKVDNSCGGQAWVQGKRWGPIEGELLHLSYGRCEMFHILREEVDGVLQGGAVKFPLRFQSGAMRARFNDNDGQLYVSGLKGWQTSGAKDGCFQRVRYTGKKLLMPSGLNVHENGVLLHFHQKLDKELAEDVGSYAVKRWNYRWTRSYGSKHYKLSNPDQVGEDPVVVTAARLLPGGKSVFIGLADVQKVMQMEIAYDLETTDGDEIIGKLHNTVHKTRKPFGG